jgi:tetratricopeptide (TPR) repeat protein
VDPGNSAALNNLGSGCILTGHPEDGIYLFRRAIARNPGSPNAHVRLTAALATQGQFEQSTSAIQRLFAKAKPRQNLESDLCFEAAR